VLTRDFYAEEDDDNSPGFWISGNYWPTAPSKDILDLAGQRGAHQAEITQATAPAYLNYMDLLHPKLC